MKIARSDFRERSERLYSPSTLPKYHKRGVRPPSFCKSKKYKSFTLKQAGYKLLGFNQLKIGKRIYKFHKSREIEGKIKTLTVKRSATGDMYIYVVSAIR